MTISVSVQPLPIFNELKLAATGTRYLNVYVIMSDPLADRYFNIIKKQIKDEQTYLETIQRQYDKSRGSDDLIRQTL